MRMSTLVLAALLSAGATAAVAQPAVSVDIGPKLADKANEYGAREFDDLSADLAASVSQALQNAADPALHNANVELVLVDAKPNRPTFKQLSDKPGLSMRSFGLGGATIEGQVTLADGRSFPVSYKWYENDLQNAFYNSTWGDAETTFDRFARRLARGETLAMR